MEIGKILRARGVELDLKPAEVARRAGMARERYGNYLSGRRKPDLGIFVRICTALETTPNELLGFPGPGQVDEVILARLLAVVPLEMARTGLETADNQVARHVAEIYALGMRVMKGEPWPEKIIDFAIAQHLEAERQRREH